MDDMISRQVAINVVGDWIYSPEDLRYHKDVINSIPAAQPEIIRCKDCKYAHMTDDDKCKYCDKWSEEYYSVEALYLDGKFFCGFAERRTDETD